MALKKIIVDCDAGYDDAIALIILIDAHKKKQIDLKAITCVAGNTQVENVIKNVFRTCEACDTLNIPVYKGAHSSLIARESFGEAAKFPYHGSDGFGDILQDTPDTSRLQHEHAIIALQKIITDNPNEITVVCLGPLTNIALAIKVFPEILNNIKDFYIMGGNSAAQGNTTSQAEFNFYADPESVHIVLGSNIKPLWLLPWETCLESDVTREWRDNVLGKIDNKVVKLMNAVEKGVYSTKPEQKFYRPCDALLAAMIVSPEIVVKSTEFHADIELYGLKTRGQVVLDHKKCYKPNIQLIEKLNFQVFQDVVFAAFNSWDQ